MKKTVVIGITSGIAAYKVLELIDELQKENIRVIVIVTKNAAKMAPLKEFETATKGKVYVDLFEKDFDYKNILTTRKVAHIQIADSADLMVVVPATANTIGKIAHGLADDFLTTTLLAVTAPVILCPSMNVNMWNNPLVQKNIATLKNLGYQIIEPVEGELACGYEGKGRLEDINSIKEEILHQLQRTDLLKGKKILITAGGTLEKIDDVRHITNRSSGKMGAAIAEACYLSGGDVLLLRANSAVTPRYLIPEKTFNTADELFSLIQNEVAQCNLFFHTAAVSDFQVEKNIQGKISSKKSFTLQLNPGLKISDEIKRLNPNLKLIVFKAEYGLSETELLTVAEKKLKDSHADAVVANDISKSDRGFQADTNEVYILLRNGTYKKIPLNTKRNIALRILEHVIMEVC